MFWQAKRVESQASRAVSHVLVATLLVAGLAMLMMLTAGAAQASRSGKEASGSVTIVHKAQRATAMMSATSAPALAKDLSQAGERCCGEGSHSQGAGCASGFCPAFSAAIDVASSGLVLLDGSTCHVLLRQDALASTRPSPDFRPPRFSA